MLFFSILLYFFLLFLGGNCLTAMIATVSLEVLNLGESLSTCRFAQRVACIANHARLVSLIFVCVNPFDL